MEMQINKGGKPMKTKNNVKKCVIIFQSFSIIFLILGIVGRVLQNQDYDLLLFGKPLLFQLYTICFLLFYLVETLAILVLFIKTKKKLLFLTYLVLIPLILFQIFALCFSSSFDTSIKLYKYPEFDTTIVIENSSDLLGDYSSVYETKNNILLKDLAIIDGTPCPLGDESLCDVKIENNKVIYVYGDSFSGSEKKQLILEYENGHFKEVTY